MWHQFSFVGQAEEGRAYLLCNHYPATFETMRNITRLLIIMLFAGLIAGVAFLSIWNIPAPSALVEKVIPDEKFPR